MDAENIQYHLREDTNTIHVREPANLPTGTKRTEELRQLYLSRGAVEGFDFYLVVQEPPLLAFSLETVREFHGKDKFLHKEEFSQFGIEGI